MGKSEIKAGSAYVEITTKMGSLNRGLKQAQKKLENFGNGMAATGMKTAGFGAAAGAAAGFALSKFAKFDDAMRTAGAVSSATSEELKAMTTKAEELGAATSWSAKDIAEGMVALSKAGFKPKQINEAIEGVQNLGRATGVGMAQAAGIAVDSMNMFGLGASEMGNVADILTATANGSSQSLPDLFEALKMVGEQAHTSGETIGDTAASIGILANLGIKGSMAGTALRNAFMSFANTNVQEKMAELGVQVLDASGNIRPMATLMGELGVAMADLPTGQKLALTTELFGLRGQLAGLGLGKSSAELQAFIDKLKNVDGVAKKTATEMDAGIGGSLRILASAVEAVQLAIGRAVSEVIQPFITVVSTAAGEVAAWIKNNQWLVTGVILATAAISAAGVAMLVVGKSIAMLAGLYGALSGAVAVAQVVVHGLTAAFAGAALPIGAVVAVLGGVLALASGAMLYVAGAGEGLRGAFSAAKTTLEGFLAILKTGGIGAAFRYLMLGMKVAWLELVMPLRKTWNALWASVAELAVKGVFAVMGIWDTLKDVGLILFTEIADGVQSLWGAMIGGIVSGMMKAVSFVMERWIRFKGLFNKGIDVEFKVAEMRKRNDEIAAGVKQDYENDSAGRKAKNGEKYAKMRRESEARKEQRKAQKEAALAGVNDHLVGKSEGLDEDLRKAKDEAAKLLAEAIKPKEETTKVEDAGAGTTKPAVTKPAVSKTALQGAVEAVKVTGGFQGGLLSRMMMPTFDRDEKLVKGVEKTNEKLDEVNRNLRGLDGEAEFA